MYFRKNPFGGEYTVFAGLEECVRFISNYKLTEEQIDFIKHNLPVSCEVIRVSFSSWLRTLSFRSLIVVVKISSRTGHKDSMYKIQNIDYDCLE